jgi:hypothetical protein
MEMGTEAVVVWGKKALGYVVDRRRQPFALPLQRDTPVYIWPGCQKVNKRLAHLYLAW